MRRFGIALSLLLSIAAAAQQTKAPAGFHVDVFARELEQARVILTLDDGTVLVSRPDMNDVVALRDTDGDGRADVIRTAVAGIEGAYGLASRGRTLFVAGVKRIVAADRLPDGSFSDAREIVGDLPDGGLHPERTIGVGPDGKLYVSIGSSCGDCLESNPEHAAMLQLDPDGANRRIYARALGHTLGFDWNPATGELWAAEPEQLNRIGDGLQYGWPLCRANSTAAIPEGMSKEKFCGASEKAALTLPSHAAATGFVFYRGAQFPEAFRNDAFVAGASKIARVHFENGQASSIEDFATLHGNLEAVAVAKDGALLVSGDDGVVYRIAYGDAPQRAMTSSAAASLDTQSVLSRAFIVSKLRGPEAVVHDEEQDVYFVSNVDGSPAAKDGNGFISRITPDGAIAQLKFIDGLDAPKGMAIRGDELWVADIDRVRAFDRTTGKELRTVDLAPSGAVFLSSIAVGPDDAVYVTDSDVHIKGLRERVRAGNGRVFRVGENGEVEVAEQGEELHSPTGIVWDGTRFLIAQGYGNEVLAWNRGMHPKAVLRGPGAYDGIVVLPNGTVIVSSDHDEGLHVGRTGELRPLFARRPTPGGIAFDRKRNRLLIPSLEGDWLEAWTLPPMNEPRTTATKEGATDIAENDRSASGGPATGRQR